MLLSKINKSIRVGNLKKTNKILRQYIRGGNWFNDENDKLQNKRITFYKKNKYRLNDPSPVDVPDLAVKIQELAMEVEEKRVSNYFSFYKVLRGGGAFLLLWLMKLGVIGDFKEFISFPFFWCDCDSKGKKELFVNDFKNYSTAKTCNLDDVFVKMVNNPDDSNFWSKYFIAGRNTGKHWGWTNSLRYFFSWADHEISGDVSEKDLNYNLNLRIETYAIATFKIEGLKNFDDLIKDPCHLAPLISLYKCKNIQELSSIFNDYKKMSKGCDSKGIAAKKMWDGMFKLAHNFNLKDSISIAPKDSSLVEKNKENIKNIYTILKMELERITDCEKMINLNTEIKKFDFLDTMTCKALVTIVDPIPNNNDTISIKKSNPEIEPNSFSTKNDIRIAHQQMKQAIERSKLPRILIVDPLVNDTIKLTANYQLNRSSLPDSYNPLIMELANISSKFDYIGEGHTCIQGETSLNNTLSKRRVIKFLKGFNLKTEKGTGYSFQKLKVNNPGYDPQNRRAEIKFFNK